MYMVKRFFLMILLVLWLFPNHLGAQEKYVLPPGSQQAGIHVSEGVIGGKFAISHLLVSLVPGDTGVRLKVGLPGAFSAGTRGMPDLPVFSSLVETDVAAGYTLSVRTLDSVVIDLSAEFGAGGLVIAKASVRKRSLSSPVVSLPDDLAMTQHPAEDDQRSSGKNAIVTLEQQGTMRGVSIANLGFNPFRYNETKNCLTVYHSIEFEMIPQSWKPAAKTVSAAPFMRALAPVVRDDAQQTLKRLTTEEPVTMVILSDSVFSQSLQPLIRWKTEKGFRILEAYTSDPDVGSTPQDIREYMSRAYHTPAEGMAPPSYLLIVGDVEHVPLSQPSGQVTDLYYTTFDGPGDYLPEMFHGRISVKNNEELSAIIDKILRYEKYGFPDPSFLNRSILIAGYDVSYASTHGNGQINYAAENYFNEQNGIEAAVYLHPAAATLDKEIQTAISEGAALVNYTGHGEYYGWLDPSFRLQHADTMKNDDKFGLMIGNGCSTNQFNLSVDCFAEAVLKLENRGAVAYIGCTNDSYWDEDYYWAVGVGPITNHPEYSATTFGYYDKLFHLGDEPVEIWAPSLGEMLFAGNMTVQQSNSGYKKYYWEIYQLMGDPSMVPWFRVPDDLLVEYPKMIPETAEKLGIRAAAYDYIALSADGVLVSAMHADRFGQAYMTIPDTVEADELLLVVTGDQRQPLVDTIYRVSSRNGYLELTGYGLNAKAAGQEGIIPAGGIFSLDLTLVNRGDRTFHASDLLLKSHDDFLTISDSVASTGAIGAGDTILLRDVFRIKADAQAEDGALFTLAIEIATLPSGNMIYLREIIHAPRLVSSGITWEDRSFGNGNGMIEAGERLRFAWTIANQGGFRSDSVALMTGAGVDTLITALSAPDIGFIPAGERRDLHFVGEVREQSAQPAIFSPVFMASDGHASLVDSLFLVTDRHFDDFSSGDMQQFRWTGSEKPWRPDTAHFSGAPYALRSGRISHSSSSSLFIGVEAGATDSIMFDLKVSSEARYDFLRFYVDSVLIDSWSGLVDWRQYVHQLSPGRHLLEWRYQKDVNTSSGDDAAWIDNVVFPLHAFDSIDMGVLRLLDPADSKALGQNEDVRLLLVNTGRTAIHGFSAGFFTDTTGWIEQLYQDTIAVGAQFELVFPGLLDLSAFGDHCLTAWVDAAGDLYPGNDTITFCINHYRWPDLALTGYALAGDTVSQPVGLELFVANQGNVPLEGFGYAVYLDDQFIAEDTVAIVLQPGSTGVTTIPLMADYPDGMESGWHTFRVVSGIDSVASNNTLTGTFLWLIQSAGPAATASFRIYPNPAVGEFTLQLPEHTVLPVTVRFYSTNGSMQYAVEMNATKKTISAASVTDTGGIYIVTVMDGAGEQVSREKIQISRVW